jgi:exopolysaccharide production protein ExoZ
MRFRFLAGRIDPPTRLPMKSPAHGIGFDMNRNHDRDIIVSKSRIAPLDFLRGLAITGVVVFHLSALFGPDGSILKYLCAQGFFGVQLFFFVSALTMCETWTRRIETQAAINFYIRRFARIAGPFWIAIAFYLYWDGSAPSFWRPDGVSARHVITALFFVHGFWPDTINAIVPGGWSIGVEMVFYLFFPMIIRVKRGTIFFLACGFAIYIFNLTFVRPVYEVAFLSHDDLLGEFLYFQFFSQAPIFLIGIGLWKALKEPSFCIEGIAIVPLLWLATAFSLKFLVHIYAAPFFWLAVCAMAFIVYFIVKFDVSLTPINRVGEISYSVYLSHFAVISCVETSFAAFGFDRATYGSFFIALFLVAAICWAAGLVLRRVIEVPSSDVGRAIIRRIEKRRMARCIQAA